MPANPYDEVPYTTFPRIRTHPDRLAAVGMLFGMKPAPVAACRVLEIGCGDASNLVPMAYLMPESRFTGIDLAAAPIGAGRAAAEALELPNLSLLVCDLKDFDTEGQQFDYIVAHGFYSWVPPAVRERLMEVCAACLSPQGIAFISYNAFPGRHIRLMLREMMQYHTRRLTEPEERIEQARWFLKFLMDSRIASTQWRTVLEQEARLVLDQLPGTLFHDDMAEINDSFYFWEFIQHSARHGLQYLGEAVPHEMFDQRGSLDWLDDDVLEREQYLDFLRARRFRQTLLCRDNVPLQRKVEPKHMEKFWFLSRAKETEGGQIEGENGVSISAVNQAAAQVAGALRDAYPLPLAFEELLPYAGGREALQEILFGMATFGFAELHAYGFPCQETVTAVPRASRLARYQAERSSYVTNACYQTFMLDAVCRRLVVLTDGTRTHEELAHALAAVEGAPPPEAVHGFVHDTLEWMARIGLMEG